MGRFGRETRTRKTIDEIKLCSEGARFAGFTVVLCEGDHRKAFSMTKTCAEIQLLGEDNVQFPALQVISDEHGGLWVRALNGAQLYIGAEKGWDIVSEKSYDSAFSYLRNRIHIDASFTVLGDFGNTTKIQKARAMSHVYIGFQPFVEKPEEHTNFRQLIILQANTAIDYYSRHRLLLNTKMGVMENIGYSPPELMRLSQQRAKAPEVIAPMRPGAQNADSNAGAPPRDATAVQKPPSSKMTH